MQINDLIEQYQKDERTQLLVAGLERDAQARVQLQGLIGASESFVLSALYRSTAYHHVIVMADKEETAYMLENLRHLLPQKEILFLPDSFKRPAKFEEINTHNILQRTETVNKISHPNAKAEIIVTYAEALFEKVVKSEVLHKSSIHIEVGEKVNIETITEILVDYDFEFCDFVYEPGQFSVRGGIVDIFSYANEYPYRIELFDNDVESIRTFNPETQLSEKKIRSVSIVPNLKTQFDSSQKTSFLNILPPNTILWIKDYTGCISLLEKCFDNAVDFKDSVHEENNEEHPFAGADGLLNTVSVENTIEQFAQRKIIEFGMQTYFEPTCTIRYNISPQPSFNKNFELLIKNLGEHVDAKIINLIFSDNTKQIERFYHIFEDLKADVKFFPIYTSIHSGFIDNDLKLACYTDHQIFNRFHKYAVKQGFSRDKALLLKSLRELQTGDYVTHIDHGVGRYSGLEKIEVNGQMQEAVRLIYANNDILYVSVNSLHKISKYSGKEGTEPKIYKLGSDAWKNLKAKTKSKIKDIAEDLIKLYALRKAQKGYAYTPDSYMQVELESSFEYEDTPDQLKATNDVKADMEKEQPMDRLVCGDVGFGKTEIAIRAAFKAACDGKQVAVLVPTTILAHQHYQSFKDRLDEFKVEIDFINRFKTTKQKKEIFDRIASGKLNIVIGTHAIVSKNVKFKDLGLLIIDEEQKFGVAVKEKLKEMKANVDTLTLTATPIPRTLQFSMMGARDLSVINTAPPNRQPVNTEVKVFNSETIKEAIEYEVYRGGQVFFVHNKVKDIADIKTMILKLCPHITVDIAHGQLEGDQLEEVMLRFMNRESDVLLCTNIIESGLNVPNANTIIINNAHWFGLSDLHQLRGRVGRGNKKAFCYLLSPPFVNLNQESRQRLRTIEEFSDLGSGFNISMRDLDIRGAGNILGGEQSGFIAEIGYDMYHKILDEAIRELKHNKYKDLYKEEIEKEEIQYVRDSQIDTDLEMLIPDNYINNISERMSVYTELNNIDNEEQLMLFSEKMVDRFGKIPSQVQELFNAIRIKWLAKKLGMERIVFKKRQMKCFFTENEQSVFFQSEVFGNIMKYIQENPQGASLKQTGTNLILSIEGVSSMRHAYIKLEDLLIKESKEIELKS
jgi:transcription-repair coupling factor (superfamily II helicase)